MSEKDFENTVYDFIIRITPSDSIEGDPNLPSAVNFLGRTKQQYIFKKAPNGIERYDTGRTAREIPFIWEIKDNWLIITQFLEGKPVDQSFYLGMGIKELITSDESFRYYLTKVK